MTRDAPEQFTFRRERQCSDRPPITPLPLFLCQRTHPSEYPPPRLACPLPPLLYGASISIFSSCEADLHPIHGAFRTTITSLTLLIDVGLPPIHLLFKHARPRHALRIACAQPTPNPAAAALPCNLTAIPWGDPVTGRHVVPYPMTREWGSVRTWGRHSLHIDIASPLRLWSRHAFPTRDFVGPPTRLTSPRCQAKQNSTPTAPPPPPTGIRQ